jgi:hypothetical protein
MMILDTGLRLDWTLRLTFHCILGRKLRTFQSRAREDGMTIKEPRDGYPHEPHSLADCAPNAAFAMALTVLILRSPFGAAHFAKLETAR